MGLPGRSGLDLGLGISYNSLVWTKVGTTMLFDPDYSNVSPGFRLDFPNIEPAYYDGDTGKYNYLMVTPSGARLQFRQTAVSNIYETVDSSYLQLVTAGADDPNDPVEDVTITVTATDGTKMSYVWIAGAYRCVQIKDRNGNYITVDYDDYGYLLSATDTLGRVVMIDYDSYGQPSTIKQYWRSNNGDATGSPYLHTYATLTYTTKTIAASFHSSLSVWGSAGVGAVPRRDRCAGYFRRIDKQHFRHVNY